MARKKVADSLDEDEPTLDISSLIDVCFLLLIYFLVTTTIQPREQDLRMSLPAGAPTDKVPEIAPLTIKLDSSGTVYIINSGTEQEPLDSDVDNRNLPMLKERLKGYVSAARSIAKEPMVKVWVDGEALEQRAVDILNCLAGAGIKNVTFPDLRDK